MTYRDVWAEVDLGAVAHNFAEINKRLSSGAKLCAVVKANAYGHGAVAVAWEAIKAGAHYLAVATLDEGLELRRAGITAPILILGIIPANAVPEAVANQITMTTVSAEFAEVVGGAAQKQGRRAKVHLKIDTGMGRIGIEPKAAGETARKIAALPNVELEGIFSHLAAADTEDRSYTDGQLAAFRQAVGEVEKVGVDIPLKHIAESAAILTLPEAHFSMARAGIIEFGLWPSQTVKEKSGVKLRPAMKLCARVAFLKEVPPGTRIGYGGEFTAKRTSLIATLPLGYADGYIRAYFPQGKAEIRGKLAPLAGRVCMDQIMLDVTDIGGVREGDEVCLFGSPLISADDAAAWLNTINYEVTSLISPRVPRIYCRVGDCK